MSTPAEALGQQLGGGGAHGFAIRPARLARSNSFSMSEYRLAPSAGYYIYTMSEYPYVTPSRWITFWRFALLAVVPRVVLFMNPTHPVGPNYE